MGISYHTGGTLPRLAFFTCSSNAEQSRNDAGRGTGESSRTSSVAYQMRPPKALRAARSGAARPSTVSATAS